MRKFHYENQGTNTYLVYEIGEQDVEDSMSLGMLTNNRISGLAPAAFTQMDNKKYIKYKITSKVSVSQLFSGPVNRKRLVGVFSGIVNAMLSAEDYMIDPRTILLDLDYIFTDVVTCETVLICLPVVSQNQSSPDLGMFFKNIMFSTQFDQTENCDHVAKIISYLNSNPVISPADFRTVLNDIQSANTATPVNTAVSAGNAEPSVPVQQKKQPVAVPQQTAPKPAVQQPVQPKPAPEKKPVLPEKNAESEDKISLFYLLQHYNKENAAKYKMQKAASKEQQPAKQTPQKQASGKAPVPNIGFAIPGQAAPAPKTQTNIEIPQPEKTPAPAPRPDPSIKAKSPEQPLHSMPQSWPASEQSPVGEVDFGETKYFDDESGMDTGTVILGPENPEQPMIPYLIFKKNNERIPVDKPVFRLGRDRQYNDFAITDNKYVGHSHCHIITRNGEYFVVDDNSKNHTYVDGVFVSPGSEIKLSHGQTLKLANEEFEFRLF